MSFTLQSHPPAADAPLHHQHVHPFISWMAVLSVATLGTLPSMILAEEGGTSPTVPTPTVQSAPVPND